MRSRSEDNRIILEKGAVLKHLGMVYVIDECIGRGSNAIVYLGHYDDPKIKEIRHRILIKELFPFDVEGKIFRNADGDITADTPAAAFIYQTHEESYDRANRFHAGFLDKHPGELDFNLLSFTYHKTSYTIMEFTGGRNVLQELKKEGDLTLQRIIAWMKDILGLLKVFHEEGYLHLDISPDNILLTGTGEKERASLIDYNSIISLETVRGDGDIILSAKEGYEYAAPEILFEKREKIGPCTDLYSLTAVFFRLLFGRKRTMAERNQMERNRFKLPDCSQHKILNTQNPIVIDMISSILKKGFQTNPRRRYHSADEMLRDFKELEERIACRGITKWALWQKGKERAVRIIRGNTAFRYIMDPEKMYPLKAQRSYATENATTEINLSEDAYLSEMTGTKPVLLLGGGGMGKSTAMLRMAYGGADTYTDTSTAILYISLFDWENNDRTYIQNEILAYLDFSVKQEEAKKELRRLLSEPIHTKRGDAPRVLLCLDGLNEASGDITPLLEEIQDLCVLSGVRIILTSRSEIVGDEYEKWTLSRLTAPEVEAILAKHHVRNPESMELMELLHVPMMLSMYIEALEGRDRKLLKLNSRDELLEEYLSVLIAKEARNALNAGVIDDMQDSPDYFATQAAVRYVLPEIAAKIHKVNRSLTEKEVFKCVEECYKNLQKKAFTGVFEKWIGHVKDMKLDARNADEWYGRMVQELLWKKLGLLVKDEEEHYRIVHQIIEEYMTQKSAEFHVGFDREKRKLRNKKRIAAASVVLAVIIGFLIYNYRMQYQLTQKQQEIIKSDTSMRIQNSRMYLEDGMGRDAIDSAVTSVRNEKEMGDVEADAMNALAEAAYAFQEPAYHSYARISVDGGIAQAAVSKDGKYLVALDEFQNLRGYDTSTGDTLWSKKTEYVGGDSEVNELKIIDGQNAALVVESAKIYLLSLDEGEEIWSLKVSDFLKSDTVSFSAKAASSPSLATVISDDGTKMAVTFEQEGKVYDWIFDVATCTCTQKVLDKDIETTFNEGDEISYSTQSVFSEQGSYLETLAVVVDYTEDTCGYVLNRLNCDTGEFSSVALDSEAMEVKEFDDFTLKQISLSEKEDFYLIVEDSYKGPITSFTDAWEPIAFFGLYSSDPSSENAVYWADYVTDLLYFDASDAGYMFVTNEEIRSYTSDNEKYFQCSLNQALYCQDAGDNVIIFLADGSAALCDKKLGQKPNEDDPITHYSPEKEISVLDASLSSMYASGNSEALCAIGADDHEYAYIFKKYGDTNAQEEEYDEETVFSDDYFTQDLKCYREFVKDGEADSQQITIPDDDDIVSYQIGGNGLAVALCNDGTQGPISEEYIPVTQYMVYNSSDKTWQKIENPLDSDEYELLDTPKLAVGDKEKIFAVWNLDNNLYFYDAAGGENRKYQYDIDYSNITDLKFMMDDRYLLVNLCNSGDNGYTRSVYIIDCSDGKIVFSDTLKDGSIEERIEVKYDDKSDRLYVITTNYELCFIYGHAFDEHGTFWEAQKGVGYYIDTENWEVIYHIPKLISADEEKIEVEAEEGKKLVYSNYDIEELIQLGEEELK